MSVLNTCWLMTVFRSKNLLCKVNFFPPKFSSPKYKRKIWREKIYFANERGPFSLFEAYCKYVSVTFKMTHLSKCQISGVIILILTLIDKCKMCHFECRGLICIRNIFHCIFQIKTFWKILYWVCLSLGPR